MRIPVVLYGAGLLALVLSAGPARAQEQGGLGLDLSGDTSETPPEAGNLGLDLSTGLDVSAPDADLQPRFALVGLAAPDKAGRAVAKRWMGWLQEVAMRTGQVASAADPTEARQQLEAEYEVALRCEEAACFGPVADTLDADVLTTARLALEEGAWTLRLWTYDRDRGVVETDVVTGRKPNDSHLLREAGTVLRKRVVELARPRALLRVSCNVSQAVVRVGERVLGAGTVEAKLPPGEVQLVVEADDYETYTRPLTLAPGETQEVKVRLELNGPIPEGPPEEEVASMKKSRKDSGEPSLLGRPALYTAVVGLAAVGAGVAMGLGVQGRARDADGDGVLDITRRDYLAARQQSMLSTVLMAGGGAVAGGSLLWLLVVPARSEPSSSSRASQGTGAGTAGTALHLVMGGSF